MSDAEQIRFAVDLQELCDKSELNEEESIKLARLLKFTDTSRLANFLRYTNPLVDTLKQRYCLFTSGDNAQIAQVVLTAHDIVFPPESETTGRVNSCATRYRNCVRRANAEYTADVIACTGAAIGVGAVTGGLGGVLFQIGCGGAAIWQRREALIGCRDDYEECIN